MMRINKAGIALIKEFEGLELKAYQDIVGVWTIGYGHTGGMAKKGMIISEETAENLLKADLKRFEAGVDSLVKIPLTGNQFAALVSLAFNVGLGAFRNSTLLKCLNKVELDKAADEFLRWNKAGGKTVPGLTRRREAERKLFLN